MTCYIAGVIRLSLPVHRKLILWEHCQILHFPDERVNWNLKKIIDTTTI